MARIGDVEKFYRIMENLEKRLGGKRILEKCDGRMSWPRRGVYFLFEDGELRENGNLRVVRVGTHALKQGSGTDLWKRLSQHKGTDKGQHPGGGNHRGSVFRLHVGTALISKNGLKVPTWSVGSTAKGTVRGVEYPVEKLVSQHIDSMPFLWICINDEPGPNSMRALIERNSIALLSNLDKEPIDPPSENWLGKYCMNKKVRRSGMWNDAYTDKKSDPRFLDMLQNFIELL